MKPDLSLLLTLGKSLTAVGEVLTAGKIKYTRDGYLDVEDNINRYTAAMLRHMFLEEYEESDGELSEYLGHDVFHAAQTACNALIRLELIIRDKGKINLENT